MQSWKFGKKLGTGAQKASALTSRFSFCVGRNNSGTSVADRHPAMLHLWFKWHSATARDSIFPRAVLCGDSKTWWEASITTHSETAEISMLVSEQCAAVESLEPAYVPTYAGSIGMCVRVCVRRAVWTPTLHENTHADSI